MKNKVAPPFRMADFEILYDQGISREGELLDLGVLHEFVEKSGAWYNYKGEHIGQGKDNARQFLREHAEMAQEIETSLRNKLLKIGDDDTTNTQIESEE